MGGDHAGHVSFERRLRCHHGRSRRAKSARLVGQKHFRLHVDGLSEVLGHELDHAIGVLENAIAESRQHEPSQALAQDAASQRDILGERHFHEARDDVDFAARVFPLLEMMRAARKGGSDLAWSS